MKDAKQTPDDRLKVSIPFEGNEKKNFKLFLARNGLKTGAFLRIAALEAMKNQSTGGTK